MRGKTLSAALSAAALVATVGTSAVTARPAAADTPPGPPVHAVLTLKHTPHAYADVTRWAQRHGLRVTHQNGDTVVVQGGWAKASSAFGAHVARWSRPQRTSVPAGLTSAVSNVAGFDTAPLYHPMAIPNGYTGTDLDSAYGVTPTSSAGQGLTIATIQFSGWNSADAKTYAQAAGIPLTSGQITTVPVNGASPTTSVGGGDVEVALDVEAVLASAPAAKQRVYVTTNDYAGSLAVYQQVASDVKAGLVQLVSMSWGMCEADVNSYTLSSLGSPIQQIVDAGATFFASSGDFGPYGCSYPGHTDTRLSVEFPASYPSVVGVGGTSLRHTASGWSETGWSSSGGGKSTNFPLPSYQSGVGGSNSNRLVPDVSALADAQYGLGVYITSAGGWVDAGGTSLATPVWAGTMAASMSAVGRTTGLGDIHAKLYAATSAFRDVTSGSTGPYSAAAGFDMVTGLGTPQWSKLAPAIGIVAPPATNSAQPPPSSGTTTTTTTSTTTTSTTSEPAPTSGGTQTTKTSGPTPSPSPTQDPTPTSSDPTPTQDPPPATSARTTEHSCPAGAVPSAPFVDLLTGDVHDNDVACAAWWDLAQGTTATTFAPTHRLSRAQMAAFLSRLITVSGGTLPSSPRNAFPDDDQDLQAHAIDQLAAVGIISGATDGRFHPNSAVTRGQMASFLARAYDYLTGAQLGPKGSGFPDVPSGDAHEADIDAVAGAGISGGYADGSFRPTQLLTREQLASFLTRLLDLLVVDGVTSPPGS